MVSLDLDSRVWTLSLDGEVLCAAAYASMGGSGVPVSWGKQIWVGYIPPSHSILVWHVLHDKLSTDATLCSRGFVFPSRCRLCFATEVGLWHLFWSGLLCGGLWDAMSYTFGHRLYLDGSVLDLWQEAMQNSFNTQLQSLWQIGIVSVLWIAWLIRNHATFRVAGLFLLRLLL